MRPCRRWSIVFARQGTHVKVLHAVEWMREMPLCFQYVARVRRPEKTRRVPKGELRVGRARWSSASRRSSSSKDFHTSVSTPDADPRHAIVETARDWPADVIVMGSHGRRGLDRLLLGSVAESVVRHAPCSVHVGRIPWRTQTGSRTSLAACGAYVMRSGAASDSAALLTRHVKVDDEDHQHVDGGLAEASRIESPLLAPLESLRRPARGHRAIARHARRTEFHHGPRSSRARPCPASFRCMASAV